MILLAVSAFGLTSLDSVARVGRLSFQEFFINTDKPDQEHAKITRFFANKYVAAVFTLVLAYILAKRGYADIWPLFGSAQLLGALSLIACAVFLKHAKRSGWMLWVPMVCMLGITFTALSVKIYSLSMNLLAAPAFGDALQLVFAVLLLALGVIVAVMGIRKLFTGRQEPTPPQSVGEADAG